METYINFIVASLLFLLLIYLLKSGRMKIFEFTALTFALIGGTLMTVMGKTPLGYVGVGIFLFGSTLRIIEIAKQPSNNRNH